MREEIKEEDVKENEGKERLGQCFELAAYHAGSESIRILILLNRYI
jgi:hypothetical protein